MALPSKEELAILETFRGNMADFLTEEQIADDMFLLRWLRARDLNLQKSEAILKNVIRTNNKAMTWRKENHLDDPLLRKPVDVYYYKNFPKWIDGIDKEGRPVYSAAFGKWDVRKVVKQGNSKELLDYLTEGFEESMRAVKVSAKMNPPSPGKAPVSQGICIFDWEGFVWSQMLHYQSIQTILNFALIYEAYYPETLHTCYFINCPSVVSTALSILRPVVAPKTMDKIKCFGSDRKVWEEEILKYIDANQLRPQFGGTKDNDENPFL